MTDGPSLTEIDAQECYRLLASQTLGRLGVVVDGRPAIFPVNFALDGQVIVVRTRPGSKATAAEHANVVFEVDDVDQVRRAGWSVVVDCLAEQVGPAHAERIVRGTAEAGTDPWVPEPDQVVWLRLIPQAISGRRVTGEQLEPAMDPRGYL